MTTPDLSGKTALDRRRHFNALVLCDEVEVVPADQHHRFVAGLGMEIPPCHFDQLLGVTRLQRPV